VEYRSTKEIGEISFMPFHFCLFGELRILQNGQQLAIPPFRVHGFLAALLLRPHLRQRLQLVGLLLPDQPEEVGRRRLSDYLYLLRKTLPELPLEIGRDEVYLPAEARWLDVEAFRLAAQSQDLELWREAVSLYRGDLLPGYYEEWLLMERESLRLQYVQLAHRVGQALLGRQRFEEALPIIERLAQEEPYDESALRMRLQAYRALGRRGAAVAAYERFVSTVADDLGIEPEPATEALIESIRKAASLHVSTVALSPDLTPDQLLLLGETALQKGDRGTVEACVERLRALQIPDLEETACLLAVDVALFFEEYDRAEQLLESCDGQKVAARVRAAELAARRRRWEAASTQAAEALIEAHGIDNSALELRALMTLANAQSQSGKYYQSLRGGERALGIARKRGNPAEIADALVLMGRLLLLQAQPEPGRSYLREALALSTQHQLPRQKGRALWMMGWVSANQGEFWAAMENYQQSLDIWRDLGLGRLEATLLQQLADANDQLGRNRVSLRLMEQALKVIQNLEEPVALAVCRYNHVFSLLYQSDGLARRAIQIAREILEVFRAHQQDGWVASTLNVLGYALWVAGDYQEALSVLDEAYQMHERLGELTYLPEVLAQKALVYLELGRPGEALESTRRALLGVTQEVVSETVVSEVYYAHAASLTATGDEEQATVYLWRSYAMRLKVASRIQDESARQAFFSRDPITRRMMQDVYARGLAATPADGVVIQRVPLSKGSMSIEVHLTVDAGPADQALKQAQGAIALRRVRLSRLLQEARAQGVSPTVAQLADLLKVSKRTVQRDLAVLRKSSSPNR
jgi:DNA-binding SARP family transcriptional activator